MTTSPKSRSVQATSEGLEKIRNRMAELEKPGNLNKKGWTQENLADKSGVSISTVKRFLKGESIDRPYVIWITGALNLDPLEVVDTKEWNQDSGNLEIDWRLVCHTKLEKQQEEQRIRRKASEMGFELNVHVPLGLVERKHQQRRDENVERGQVYQLGKEVITKTYKHQEFLQQVINQRPAGKNKQIAIVGEPGAGKTTLLNAIALYIKDNTQNLPICISLGSLQGMTLENYLLKKWLPDAIKLVNPLFVSTPEIENQLITRFYQSGVWLLLDGVDEMGESSPIEALNKISKELTNWLGQARVILTCRLNVWDASLNNNILPGFDTYKTQEFKAEQVDEFIYEWFTHAKNLQQGEELKAKLKQPGKERICELVTNPLRLVLLCQIFNRGKHGELPETKAGLFEIYTRYFYDWKPELVPQELIDSHELRQELHQALGKLALAGINNDSRFRLQESLAVQEMGERLFKFACGVGWLNLVDRDAASDEPVYAFFHANFQEYFAALVIDDWHYFLNHNNQNPNPLIQHNNQDCVYRIFEPQWQEVILLWIGRKKIQEDSKKEFYNALFEFEDKCFGFYRRRTYLLLKACFIEFNDPTLANHVIKQLHEWKLPDRESENKSSILKFETITRNDQVPCYDHTEEIQTKINIIKTSQDIDIIWEAIEELEDIGHGNPEVIELLTQLLSSDHECIRYQSAHTLSLINDGDKNAVRTLEKLLESSNDESFLLETAKSLVDISPNHVSAISTLVNLVCSAQDYISQLAAWYLLVYHGDALRQLPNTDNRLIKFDDSLSQTWFLVETSPETLNVCLVYRYGDQVAFIPDYCFTVYEETTKFIKAIFQDDFAGAVPVVEMSFNEHQEWENKYKLWKETWVLKDEENSLIDPEYLFTRLLIESYEEDRKFCKENRPAASYIYKFCEKYLEYCSYKMSYYEFYRAWHGDSSPLQSLETQFTDIDSVLSQLEPTDKTHPLVINLESLQDETDSSAVSQEICNQIYFTAFTKYIEIPEVNNAPQLKRIIPKIKKHLQRESIALIINCEPNQAIITFSRKLTDVLHIAFITDKPLDAPLKGFPPNQLNLLSAIQSWINEIG